MTSPIDKTKDEYKDLIDKIGSPNSPVGIDAAYTHAIVIEYLQKIESQLTKIEEEIEKLKTD
jgi:hypothetical protein